ncbi:MAG TPA: sigma-70 family RNA polymerase sigma factor [Longimicrobiales bacterium]|nr:sigma-70 family RNA polymerase sigma factor [Longimicrobiales bacterium]
MDLMLALRDGDPSALEALVGRYWEPLVRYAVRLLHSVDVAEDAVQDAFLTVWEERKSWKPVGTPQAYLYRIVRNRALQEVRIGELHARKAPEVARRRPTVPTPLEVTAGRELDRAFQEALDALPDRRRDAFVLRRYHRLTLAEVAETMGVSPQTVSNHVSMAVAELRKALQTYLP